MKTIFLCAVLLAASSSNANAGFWGKRELKCSDKDVVNTVTTLASQEFHKNELRAQQTRFAYFVDHETIKLNSIRTRNGKDGILQCAGDVSFDMIIGWDKKITKNVNVPVTYTAEVTDKGDDVYVTVKGLNDY